MSGTVAVAQQRANTAPMQPPAARQQREIETIVIDDSDSDPDMPEVIADVRPAATRVATDPDKTIVLPGPGQRGQKRRHLVAGSEKEGHLRTSDKQSLSERAKSKAKASDAPTPASPQQQVQSAPYRADVEASPISLPLFSTYNCPICLCPPVSAVTTPCGHLFCGGCLFDALLTQTKKKHEEDAERRIFIVNSLNAALPLFHMPAFPYSHLGMFSRRNNDNAAAFPWLYPNASGAANPSAAEASSGPSSSTSTGRSTRSAASGASSSSTSDSRATRTATSSSSSNGHDRSRATSSLDLGRLSSEVLNEFTQATFGTASTATPSGPSASTSTSSSASSFMNGARAAAQNAFDRLRPFALAMFHPEDAATGAGSASAPSPSTLNPSTSQSSGSTSLSASQSSETARGPGTTSAGAASSGGDRSSAGTSALPGLHHLLRGHPGLTSLHPFASAMQAGGQGSSSRSGSSNSSGGGGGSTSSIGRHASPAPRPLHNLAGICPLCRGSIPKGFNVNKRSRPPTNRYLHRDGRPRRGANDVDPLKGKIVGLRLMLGRPVDDPAGVAMERARVAKRRRVEVIEEVVGGDDEEDEVAVVVGEGSSMDVEELVGAD